MRGLRGYHTTDDDGLQTDVMRFMAIIAFCLVAVLALVKDLPPTEQPSPAEEKRVQAEQKNEPVAPQVVEAPAAKPEVKLVMPPIAKPTAKIVAAPAPEAVKPAPVAKTVEPQPAADPITEPTPIPTASDDEEGLTLRFASDADFIDLIRRGKVRVYAYNANNFHVLDRGFVFRPAQPPKTFHELETVPARVRAALTSAMNDNRWGVRLPSNTQQSIQQLANRHTSGQLVIDRTGGVRHVQSS